MDEERELIVPIIVEIILLPIFIILSCIAIAIMIHSIQHLYCKYSVNNSELNSPIRHVTAIATTTYLLTVLLVLIWTILAVIESNTKRGEEEMALIGTILALSGRWSMLLLFVMRIDYTFRDSIFQYPKYIIFCLYSIIAVLFILILILWIFGFTYGLILPRNISYDIRVYGVSAFIIIEFLLSNLLIILFLRKLFTLFLKRMKHCVSENVISIEISIDQSKNGSNGENTDKDKDITKTDKETPTSIKLPPISPSPPASIQIPSETPTSPRSPRSPSSPSAPSTKPKSFDIGKSFSDIAIIEDTMRKEQVVHEDTLTAMTKYTLLVIIAIVSSTLSLTISLFVNWAYYVAILVGIDAFINGFCIYLFNKFSVNIYNVVCKYPHKASQCCCRRCISCVYFCSE